MRWVGKFGRVLLVGFLALFSFLPVAFADDLSPSDWDVQIDSYTRGPNYCDFTITLPAGYDGVNTYEYTSTTDSSPYRVQQNPSMTPNSDGTYTFILYDMQGGGYDTYMKMTATDDAGNETNLPSDFFILQQDVAVYIDGVSPDVLAELQSALANLETAAGVPSVVSAGSGLQSSLTSAGANLDTPGGDGLDVGINFGANQWWNGQEDFMSASQIANFPWLSTLREVAQALMWISVVIYLVRRFAPIFKV